MDRQMPNTSAYFELVQAVKQLTLLLGKFESSTILIEDLTPQEKQICAFLKRGLSAKEIASLCHVSKRTVEKHREHIRKKFGIQNKKINLTIFLQGPS